MIDLCKSLNLTIVNGRKGNDLEVGSFTFEHTQGKSTIDYAIVSSKFYPYVSNFEVDILDQSLSDFHCPIILTIKNLPIERADIVNELSITSDIIYKPIYSRWDPGRIKEYQSNLESDRYSNFINSLETLKTKNPDEEGIDKVVK